MGLQASPPSSCQCSSRGRFGGAQAQLWPGPTLPRRYTTRRATSRGSAGKVRHPDAPASRIASARVSSPAEIRTRTAGSARRTSRGIRGLQDALAGFLRGRGAEGQEAAQPDGLCWVHPDLDDDQVRHLGIPTGGQGTGGSSGDALDRPPRQGLPQPGQAGLARRSGRLLCPGSAGVRRTRRRGRGFEGADLDSIIRWYGVHWPPLHVPPGRGRHEGDGIGSSLRISPEGSMSGGRRPDRRLHECEDRKPSCSKRLMSAAPQEGTCRVGRHNECEAHPLQYTRFDRD